MFILPTIKMFKLIPFAALILLPSFPAFGAAPRMDALAISRAEAGTMRGCASDKLCIHLAPSPDDCEGDACIADVASDHDWKLKLSGRGTDPANAVYRLTNLSSIDEESSFELWPKLIRFKGGILAGVETSVHASYSGGGGGATTLHLIAFLPHQPPFEVLSIPQSANLDIRACFSESDAQQRAGACHDSYTFNATLALPGTSAAGMPVLRYRSEATSFPGPVSRWKDSLAAPPLRESDLVTVVDPQCSYQRSFHFDPKARSYVPDVPLPDCSNYTEP